MGEPKVTIDCKNWKKEIFCIEYPGKVINQEKAVDTLGGLDKISKAFTDNKTQLALNFHPNNPYNKPTIGDIKDCRGILLKVKIQKPKGSNISIKQHIEVLGHCNKTVKFKDLCDFQYLPVHKKPNTNEAECIFEKIIPSNIIDEPSTSENDIPLFCPPAVFARFPTIQTKLFTKDLLRDNDENVLGIIRNRAMEIRVFHSFSLTDPVPDKPNPNIFKKMKIKFITDEEVSRVEKLFEKCPIWPKVAILYETGLTNEKIKVILPSLSYYYSTGPWRTMYVRYGYDPRKDYQSRCHQTFDFRLRLDMASGKYVRNKRFKFGNDNFSSKENEDHTLPNAIQAVNYPYLEKGYLPRSRQCFYRYSDIRLPKVMEMLEKLPPPMLGEICNEISGWVPHGFHQQIREVIKDYLEEQVKLSRNNEQELDSIELYEENEIDDDNSELGEEFNEDIEFEMNQLLLE